MIFGLAPAIAPIVGDGLLQIGPWELVFAFHRLAWAGTFGFGAQFLYIGGAAIFVVDLLGLGELDF